ncbi:putative protein TPRXL [Rhodamnia argentea]|uniref:Uncharacterized protein n=1 Tax=Rhodamnia argentea TaxID=178133 RepID=A0A8B8P171_9MYRT|nr:putative protein TPRXL [Rhodamnia argentea]
MDSSSTSPRPRPRNRNANPSYPSKSPPPSSSSRRRSPSFSSSSSSTSSLSSSSSLRSSQFPDEFSFGPATPLRFSGVPFSWEKIPGIPKKQSSRRSRDCPTSLSSNLLPLPPSATPPSSKRYANEEVGRKKKVYGATEVAEWYQWDPFVAALVECSKDHDQAQDATTNKGIDNLWNGTKVSRRIGDRLGLIGLYTSCKRACPISESIIYLPRSNQASYGLINRRSH